ncbi:XAC0095 family protein [Dyella nitratireducens]|uniref:Uncharacterized protein n=1 Tax=Dyella nitratireducens TaxID=1849580 RepID=A0ABQ1FY75_9GAMM|nr:hypothetical protein [Dyella nitratireducens]GGA31437.1 hypothetical protein GCM10010981_20670 [Dyella nitratireducens]GLQ42870.1 hypothetical protein GCM10007902_27200 [Dyella nitratireducens]
MEDMHSGRCGPQLYLLSREGYETIKRIQAMLDLMAHITYNDEHTANGDAMITMGRAELFFIFQAVNIQLDDVLDGVGNENWLGDSSPTWQ